MSIISEAMGHDSENTTRIYLASLDMSVVDKANSLILKSLSNIYILDSVSRFYMLNSAIGFTAVFIL